MMTASRSISDWMLGKALKVRPITRAIVFVSTSNNGLLPGPPGFCPPGNRCPVALRATAGAGAAATAAIGARKCRRNAECPFEEACVTGNCVDVPQVTNKSTTKRYEKQLQKDPARIPDLIIQKAWKLYKYPYFRPYFKGPRIDHHSTTYSSTQSSPKFSLSPLYP